MRPYRYYRQRRNTVTQTVPRSSSVPRVLRADQALEAYFHQVTLRVIREEVYADVNQCITGFRVTVISPTDPKSANCSCNHDDESSGGAAHDLLAEFWSPHETNSLRPAAIDRGALQSPLTLTRKPTCAGCPGYTRRHQTRSPAEDHRRSRRSSGNGSSDSGRHVVVEQDGRGQRKDRQSCSSQAGLKTGEQSDSAN
jgi:hypothetical protein